MAPRDRNLSSLSKAFGGKTLEWIHMSDRLNSIKGGLYKDLRRGLFYGLLRGILGVWTMAHMRLLKHYLNQRKGLSPHSRAPTSSSDSESYWCLVGS